MDEVIEAIEKYQGLVPLVYDIETMVLDEARPQDMPYAVYLKREADKVIAHQKYKRCLALAEWCNSEMGRETFACFRPRHTKEVWREEHKYWAKWRKIWFELYIKFKEAK